MGPFVLVSGEHSIGRAHSCDVALLDETVSREHARIVVNDAGVALIDLGSASGTVLNDVRLEPHRSIRLTNGDCIRIGPWAFSARVGPAVSQASTQREKSDAGTYATRATVFLRMKDGAEHERELGWQEFSDRYRPVILGFARNAGLASQDAEDVLQDVLLGFFRVSDAFEYDPSRGRFRGYLKRATLNVIRKRLRRRDRVMGEDDAGDAAIDGDRLDAVWEREWAAGLLSRAIDAVRSSFDPRTFEAFELYVVRGLPAEVVAERLGMRINSVHQARSRVGRAVDKHLQALREEEG